jgi:hypothetical protein
VHERALRGREGRRAGTHGDGVGERRGLGEGGRCGRDYWREGGGGEGSPGLVKDQD